MVDGSGDVPRETSAEARIELRAEDDVVSITLTRLDGPGEHPNQLRGVFAARVGGRSAGFEELCTRWEADWFVRAAGELSSGGAGMDGRGGCEFESEDGEGGIGVVMRGRDVHVRLSHDGWSVERNRQFEFVASTAGLDAFIGDARRAAAVFPAVSVE